MNSVLLIVLLLAFWGLSLYWRRHPGHPLLLLFAPAAGLFFLIEVFRHPERRYFSLFLVVLAAVASWRAYQAYKTRVDITKP